MPKAATEAYARHGRRLPDVVAVLLALLIGTLLAQLIWALVPAPSQRGMAGSTGVGEQHAPQRDGRSQRHQHRRAVRQVRTASEPVRGGRGGMRRIRQLALTLLGIFADSRDAKSSRALIGKGGDDEAPYSIGDDISRGVSLQAIFPDRVVLSRNGRLETLRLDKDQPGSDAVPQVAGEEPTLDAGAAQQLADIRNKMLSDPSKAQDFIRVQPVPSSNGGQLGYRIYPGRDRSLFTAAGLRPGDVVTSVNGMPLNDPTKSIQMLGDLSQAQQLNVVIDRGGQSQTVSVSLNP